MPKFPFCVYCSPINFDFCYVKIREKFVVIEVSELAVAVNGTTVDRLYRQ